MGIDHITPLFCPLRLVPYRSMNEEDPSGLLHYPHPPHIEQLNLKEGDPSRRIDDESLQRYWMMSSQKASVKLPIWTIRDSILQKIAMSTTDYTGSKLSYGSESPSFTPAVSMTSPTLKISEKNDNLHPNSET